MYEYVFIICDSSESWIKLSAQPVKVKDVCAHNPCYRDAV